MKLFTPHWSQSSSFLTTNMVTRSWWWWISQWSWCWCSFKTGATGGNTHAIHTTMSWWKIPQWSWCWCCSSCCSNQWWSNHQRWSMVKTMNLSWYSHHQIDGQVLVVVSLWPLVVILLVFIPIYLAVMMVRIVSAGINAHTHKKFVILNNKNKSGKFS